MASQPPVVDLEIFKDLSQTGCSHEASEDTLLIENCPALKRLVVSSRYLDSLTAYYGRTEEMRLALVEFCVEAYTCVLDDCAHLVKQHGDDIQRVHREAVEHYGVVACSLSSCLKSTRHYARGRRNHKRDDADDAVFAFYESIFDRFHHFVAHLFDVGLRVDRQLVQVDKEEEEEDDQNESKSDDLVDAAFKKEKALIAQKKAACDIDLGRLQDAHNKFVIDVAEAANGHSDGQGKMALTFSDALLQEITEHPDVSQHDAVRLASCLIDNEYDTESIDADFQDVSASNICQAVQNAAIHGIIGFHLKSRKCVYICR